MDGAEALTASAILRKETVEAVRSSARILSPAKRKMVARRHPKTKAQTGRSADTPSLTSFPSVPTF